MKIKLFLIALCLHQVLNAQIPVELLIGHERSTIDIMFFKNFKTTENQTTPWLFFNRNRASIDYRMTSGAYLPQFGFTEAISYNPQKLKGFAPVYVVQVLSGGVFSKVGLQYARVSKEFTFFTWLVGETTNNPSLDYFILLRYTPIIHDQLNLFTQFESVNAFPTDASEKIQLTQRYRLGIQKASYQIGFGADFNQTGKKQFTPFYNLGLFARHEF